MKVRFLKGDTAGDVGYLDYHSVQAALQSDPESLEIIDGYPETRDPGVRAEGVPADNAERAAVVRSPVAAADLSEDGDPTQVTTAGRGAVGGDASRSDPSTTHTADLAPAPPQPFAHPAAAPNAEEGRAAAERAGKAAQDRVATENAKGEEARRVADSARERGERTQADLAQAGERARGRHGKK